MKVDLASISMHSSGRYEVILEIDGVRDVSEWLVERSVAIAKTVGQFQRARRTFGEVGALW